MSISISFDKQNWYATLDDHDGVLTTHIQQIMGKLREPRPTPCETRQGSSTCTKHPDMLPWEMRDRKDITLGELYWPTLFQSYSDLLVAIPCSTDKPLWWEHPAVVNGQIFGENADVRAYVQLGSAEGDKRIGIVMRVIDCFRFTTQHSQDGIKTSYETHPNFIVVRLSDDRFYASRDVQYFGDQLVKPSSLWKDVDGIEVVSSWKNEVKQWDDGFEFEEKEFGFSLDPNVAQSEQGLLNDSLAWMNGVVPIVVPKLIDLATYKKDNAVANYGFAPAATHRTSDILPAAWSRSEWSSFTVMHPYPRKNPDADFGSPETDADENSNFIWENRDDYDSWKDRQLTVDLKGNFCADGWVQSDFYYNLMKDKESTTAARRAVFTSLYSNQKSSEEGSGSNPSSGESSASGEFKLENGFPAKDIVKAAAQRFENQYEWLRRVSSHQDGLYLCNKPQKLFYESTSDYDISRLACDSFYIRSVENMQSDDGNLFGLMITLRSYHVEMPTFDVPVTWNETTGELADIDTGVMSYAEGEVVEVNGSTEFARVSYSRGAYLIDSIVPLLLPNFWPTLRVGDKINMQRFPARAVEWWDPQWVPLSKEC